MNRVIPFVITMFRSVLFIMIGLLFSSVFKLSLAQASRWWSLLCTISNIITILVLLLICKYDKIFYRDLINYKKGQSSVKLIVLVIFMMLILGMIGMYAFGFMIYGYVPTTMVQPIPIWIAIINAILLPVTVVFAEMPLYFGYALPKIEEITHNKFVAVGFPMFFYALQHSFIPLILDWKYILFRFLSFVPLILVLGMVYYKNRRLVPLMIGHGVLDLATGTQIIMTSISPAIFEMMQTMNK